MNTPVSFTVPPPPKPDPTTPGPTERPTALGSAFTTVAAGSPLAVATVWVLETFVTVHGQPLKLDSVTAAALGGIGAAVAGYTVHVLSGLWAIVQERLTRP